MRLVNHDGIPGVCIEELAEPSTLVAHHLGPQRVDGRDDHIRRVPKIQLWRVDLSRIWLKPDVEHLTKALLPLRDEFRRRED
jgi:hypothetical protein